jgi:hypothetical protein
VSPPAGTPLAGGHPSGPGNADRRTKKKEKEKKIGKLHCHFPTETTLLANDRIMAAVVILTSTGTLSAVHFNSSSVASPSSILVFYSKKNITQQRGWILTASAIRLMSLTSGGQEGSGNSGC